MVIELYVGPVAQQFAAWCPMLPGMVSFSHDPDRAVAHLRLCCQSYLSLKRKGCPSLPDPELLDWVTRRGEPPRCFKPAFEDAVKTFLTQMKSQEEGSLRGEGPEASVAVA